MVSPCGQWLLHMSLGAGFNPGYELDRHLSFHFLISAYVELHISEKSTKETTLETLK